MSTQTNHKENPMETTTKAAELRASAAADDRRAEESFARCDTDGFMSQWASGLTADQKRLEAELLESGGTATFTALFDLEGNPVEARLIDGKYGPCWALCHDDPDYTFTGTFITAYPKREATMRRKGYLEGTVTRKARSVLRGADMCNVRAVAEPVDRSNAGIVDIVSCNRWEDS